METGSATGVQGIFELAGHFDPAGVPGALALMILGTTTPFPAEISAIAVAMKHALWPALALVWSGAMVGAMSSYLLARAVGERAAWLRRVRGVRLAEARLRDLGWLGVFGLRLIPLVPFFALSLAAGLLRVPVLAYVKGTAAGIVPATVLLTLAGRGLISEDRWQVTIVVIGLVAALFLWLLFLRRAGRHAPPEASEDTRAGAAHRSQEKT